LADLRHDRGKLQNLRSSIIGFPEKEKQRQQAQQDKKDADAKMAREAEEDKQLCHD